jgi:hypothetical protein
VENLVESQEDLKKRGIQMTLGEIYQMEIGPLPESTSP